MAKFAQNTATNRGVLRTTGTPTTTYEGGPASYKDDKTALFTLGVTTLLKDKFYESGNAQLTRLQQLVRRVTKADPQWVADFAKWLRNDAYIRSASIVVAAEYVAAGGPNGRSVVASVIQRADEPAEMLGYWHAVHGRRLPAAVKRGVADASVRVFNEYTVQKYDGSARDYRVGDVINIVHPKPKAEWQSDLFSYALDRRYKGSDAVPAESLTQIQASKELDELLRAEGVDKFFARPDAAELLRQAGWTWERVSGYGAFSAKTWEALVPTMGYMALLRNLRNFEQAGVSASTVKYINSVLSDPERVRSSKQFPYRFYNAYVNVESNKFKQALEEALNESIHNLPTFNGHTHVTIDTSGSMQGGYGWGRSRNGDTPPVTTAAIFGVGLALRNDATLSQFASSAAKIVLPKGTDVLSGVRHVERQIGKVGHGTDFSTVKRLMGDEQRLVVLTDGQYMRGFKPTVWTHYVDIVGYQTAPATDGKTFMYGGLTDATLRSMPLLERGAAQQWPWDER